MKTAIVPFQMVVFSERHVTFLAFEFKQTDAAINVFMISIVLGVVALVSEKQVAAVTVHFYMGRFNMNTQFIFGT